MTLPINHELVTSAKLRLVSVFPDIDKDYPKIRNLPKIFLISFANVAPDAKKRDHITDALISLHWYECRKGLCSRSQCRLTGHCTVMPLSTCGSLHQSPTSCPDKDFGLPPRTICAFLPSDCLLLDVVLSLSLALVFGTLFLPTSLQHLLCSLSENV